MRAHAAFNFEAFLDGITGAGLFSKRVWPGAPAFLLADDDEEQVTPNPILPVSAKLTAPPGIDQPYRAESREAGGLLGLRVK